MQTRPPIVAYGIAFAFGTIVPVTLGSLLVSVPGVAALGDLLVLVWVGLIVLATVGVGVRLALPTDALLGGGILGTITGFWAVAELVGWSFVMFAVAPLAIVGLVCGAWITYEHQRRTGVARELPVGSWRLVFVLITAVLVAIPLLLLVA